MNNFQKLEQSLQSPTNYEIFVTYVNGQTKTFPATAHFIHGDGVLEIWDLKSIPHYIPVQNVFEITFDDKNYKILLDNLRKEEAEKQASRQNPNG